MIFNFLFKHRGALHSITFCIILTIILALFSQKLALPFFLGYAIHLLADSFTITGIRAFWPSKKEIKWIIRTGGLTEKIIFYLLILTNILVIVSLIR
jgi:inner membrane protein